jgi:hypothetical protein
MSHFFSTGFGGTSPKPTLVKRRPLPFSRLRGGPARRPMITFKKFTVVGALQ